MSYVARSLLLFALTIVVAAPTKALTFLVDSTVDAVDAVPGNGVCATAGGACTLRAAIQEANATAAADTIDLPEGTYTLTLAGADENSGATGDLDTGGMGPLIITGAGATTTIIDGGALDRVVHHNAVSACCTLTITDVTIQNGSTADFDGGAGILAWGLLILERVILRDNHTTGVGGGLSSKISGTVQMRDSVVTENSAARGGGVDQFVDSIGMTLSNVTISGNSATGSGGGLNDSTFGVHLHNVTISNNTADHDANGSGSGGGISGTFVALFLPNVFVRNTIVAGNIDTGGEAPDCVLVGGGAITSEGYNLIGDTTGCTISGDPTGNVTNVAPLLDPLADNGGGTLTHALSAGSPAIDAGKPAAPGSGGTTCEATDQRAVTRPFGPRCDIGAFEGGAPSSALLDHYKCYVGVDLRNPEFMQQTVQTSDQLGNETVEVKKLKFVCVPVDKNGEGISNPAAHLVCYQAKGAVFEPRPVVMVSTQFQASRFQLKKPKLLCAPATKVVIP